MPCPASDWLVINRSGVLGAKIERTGMAALRRLNFVAWRKAMARKKSKGKGAAFTMFNVTYEDGTITSNRRVSTDLLDQSFGGDVLDMAHTAIKEQDNEIARRSEQKRAKIKTIIRA